MADERPWPPGRTRPYPSSVCHQCDAPRYVHTERSTFILCTRLPNKYPAQPVARCEAFSRRAP
jgi:hypothetical protein